MKKKRNWKESICLICIHHDCCGKFGDEGYQYDKCEWYKNNNIVEQKDFKDCLKIIKRLIK